MAAKGAETWGKKRGGGEKKEHGGVWGGKKGRAGKPGKLVRPSQEKPQFEKKKMNTRREELPANQARVLGHTGK